MRSTFEDLASCREGSRWQRAQRQRYGPRRRLTRRGRATLGGAALLVGALAGVGVGVGARRDSLADDLAPVSAGAPPVRSTSGASRDGAQAARTADPAAPAALLERLPAGLAALTLPVTGPAAGPEAALPGRLYEIVAAPAGSAPAVQGPLRIEYSLDAALTREVFDAFEKGRVTLGHVIVFDPATGRVLAYASTDTEHFDPTRTYPAASLVKVITASAALDADPDVAKVPCRFTGSPYRLTPSRLDPPRRGREVTLERALATSNNQCFAQLAVHRVGSDALLDALGRFGWLSSPAPAHAVGVAEPAEDRFDLGKLGCGLDGCRITPLHAAQLAGVMANGELVSPRWIDRILDASGRELALPPGVPPRRVLAPERASDLRTMLVETTTRGTARRAFRQRNGRPLLGDIKVAGKTGSLSGKDPDGRYEWFAGVAPADEPRIAVAVLLVQGPRWWRTASQLAGDVMSRLFCERGRCRVENLARYMSSAAPGPLPAPAVVGSASPALTQRR